MIAVSREGTGIFGVCVIAVLESVRVCSRDCCTSGVYGHVCVIAVLLRECGYVCVIAEILESLESVRACLCGCCTSRVYDYVCMIAVLLESVRVFLRDNCTSRECTGMFA